jgi:hypothetical protein
VNRGRLAWCVLAGSLAAACSIDDRMLTVADGASGGIGSPPPSTDVVIDTFEHGTVTDRTVVPDDPRFFGWKVESLDAATQSRDDGQLSIVDAGGYDGRALQLAWQVRDVPDGMANHPGVSLELSLLTSIDLSAFSSIVFAHRYAHEGACQPVPLVTVAISCPNDGVFETFASLSPAWTATTVPLADLQEAGLKTISRDDCLRQVYTIAFNLEVSLSDGDCASGTLWLDDVALRF